MVDGGWWMGIVMVMVMVDGDDDGGWWMVNGEW